MKLVALKRSGNLLLFIRSPYFSNKTKNLPFKISSFKIFTKLISLYLVVILYYQIIIQYIDVSQTISYMFIALYIYLLMELISINLQTLYAPFSKTSIHPIHNNPLLSKNLTEFWSRRWNSWVRDWLRDALSQMKKKYKLSSRQILFISFTLSGVFHELLINLPYYLYFKEIHFGNMIIYFILQSFGIIIDKKLKKQHFLKYLNFIFFTLILSFIFINKPLLSILGFL